MGFYYESTVRTPATVRRAALMRVRLSDTLGAINPMLAAINAKYGTSIGVPTSPAPLPTAPPITGSFALPLISQPAPAPLTINTRNFSPATAPTPVPVSAPTAAPASAPPPPPPPPSTPFDSGPATPPPQTVPDNPSGGSSGSGFDTGTPSPSSPSPSSAASPTQIRFAADSTPLDAPLMPDASGPEVYNADGTPVTAAAKTQTIIDKFNALPTAAKVGGAVVLYLIFARR